ncbi:hypothetical protein HDU87_004747 [Geranomyces variabilis]|uniref:Uncharacterized protein n=1 Tax=Geranomyces variabilis TaxID=109894 RepID=A0AAD5XPR5_9FUNG|nr:hypothetical protein HDU87_004747 [Geranomyces variabilis]
MAKITGLFKKIFRGREHQHNSTYASTSTVSLPATILKQSSSRTSTDGSPPVRRSVSFQLSRPSTDAEVGVGERNRVIRTSKSWDGGDRLQFIGLEPKRKKRWSARFLPGKQKQTAAAFAEESAAEAAAAAAAAASRGCFSLDERVPQHEKPAPYRNRSVDGAVVPPMHPNVYRLRRSNSYSNLKRGEMPERPRRSRSLERVADRPVPPPSGLAPDAAKSRFSFLRKLKAPSSSAGGSSVVSSAASTPRSRPPIRGHFSFDDRSAYERPADPMRRPSADAATMTDISPRARVGPRRSNSFTGRSSTDRPVRTSRSWDGSQGLHIVPPPPLSQKSSRFSFLRNSNSAPAPAPASRPQPHAHTPRRAYFSLDGDATAFYNQSSADVDDPPASGVPVAVLAAAHSAAAARRGDVTPAAYRRRTMHYHQHFVTLPTVSEVGSSVVTDTSTTATASASAVTGTSVAATSAYEAYLRRIAPQNHRASLYSERSNDGVLVTSTITSDAGRRSTSTMSSASSSLAEEEDAAPAPASVACLPEPDDFSEVVTVIHVAEKENDMDAETATSLVARASACDSEDSCSTLAYGTANDGGLDDEEQQYAHHHDSGGVRRLSVASVAQKTGPLGVVKPTPQWSLLHADVLDLNVDWDALVRRWA